MSESHQGRRVCTRSMQLPRALLLRNGRPCSLSRPDLPGLDEYYVLSLNDSLPQPEDIDELAVMAQRIGRALARAHHGDPECYSLIYNAGRTRRTPLPHFHILMARSTREKRTRFLLLQLKHVLRWRKWPWVAALARLA